MRELKTGHVLDRLAEVEPESVQAVVTSPPYLWKRHYPEAEVVWPDSWYGAFGWEPSVEMYLQHTLLILSELRRVLRRDGSVFWNLGDTRGSSEGDSGHRPERDGIAGVQRVKSTEYIPRHGAEGAIPPRVKFDRQWLGIPHRVALAAQADGWRWEDEIVWEKPGPMPESCDNRTTRAHEYIMVFNLSKSAFYDADAVREPNAPTTSKWGRSTGSKTAQAQGDGRHGGSSILTREMSCEEVDRYYTGGRNLRSVWRFSTVGYPGAHFATFPPELPRRCILAGTPEKACAKCGAPWTRVTESSRELEPQRKMLGLGPKSPKYGCTIEGTGLHQIVRRHHLGFRSTCICFPRGEGQTRPAIVLDPFAGSGTTLAVAEKLGRWWIGIEIAQEYRPLIEERLAQPSMAAEFE